MTNPNRPTPIRDAASSVSKGIGVAVSFVVAIVGFGLFTAVQGDAVTGLLGLVPGLVTQVGVVLSAFNVVRKAEPKVTPIASPQDNAGNALTPDTAHGTVGGM